MPDKTVRITIKFVTILQEYSGRRRVEMEVPPDPAAALDAVIAHFAIPWKGRLEKSSRIFINRQISTVYIQSGQKLADGDQVIFIPISGGG